MEIDKLMNNRMKNKRQLIPQQILQKRNNGKNNKNKQFYKDNNNF